MKHHSVVWLAFLGALAIAGCKEQKAALPPHPHVLNEASTGRYCGMQVLEHAGPKGQIILASSDEPIWFSSARDAFAFTMLPEEPKDVRAVFVSDMSVAPSWEAPGASNWIDAAKAFFVIGSRLKGGMGADETVPFSTRQSAERFAAENGGTVAIFQDVPRDYVLSAPAEEPPDGEGHVGTHKTH
jgi:copper chaperone NosL